MSNASSRGDGSEDRERAWMCEVLNASRAHLDRLYEAYAPQIYRMALQCTATEAEAEKVTEAVFLTVFRDLASWTDGGPSVLLAIFGAARHELSQLAGPSGELTERAPWDELATPTARTAKRSTTVAAPGAASSRRRAIASP